MLDRAATTTTAEQRAVSRILLQATFGLRGPLRAERDAFYVSLGGFDTHSDIEATLQERLAWVDNALNSFTTEMRSLGVWDKVTIQIASEFGRTITSNSLGTDHGWGGNAVVLGGSVNGGKILGRFPTSLGEESELHVGRGRLIPTTSWESVFHALAQWMGVEGGSAAMGRVLPNAGRFMCDRSARSGCGVMNASDVFR